MHTYTGIQNIIITEANLLNIIQDSDQIILYKYTTTRI